MYPLKEPRLMLADLTSHWARSMPERVPRLELVNNLLKLFWLKRFDLGTPTVKGEELRQVLLKLLFEATPPPPQEQGLVFYEDEDELPPDWYELPDGSSDMGDRRSRIRVPRDPSRWTAKDREHAYQQLSNCKIQEYPADTIVPIVMMIKVSREEFAALCDQEGWRRPSFWFNSPWPSSEAKVKLADASRCRRWLEGLKSRPPQMTKNGYWAQAQEKFPSLSKRGFLRIWQEAAPAEWRKAGRRPSRRRRQDSFSQVIDSKAG